MHDNNIRLTCTSISNGLIRYLRDAPFDFAGEEGEGGVEIPVQSIYGNVLLFFPIHSFHDFFVCKLQVFTRSDIAIVVITHNMNRTSDN